MALYEVKGKQPVIGKGTWIAPTAAVIGEVTIGQDCYIGFGAVIRADFGPIRIGDGSVVEDNAVIHTGSRTTIGNEVIIAHQAMVHDAVIGNRVLVGTQALISDKVDIGDGAWIAEQTHVRSGDVVNPGSIMGGSPAIPLGNVTQAQHQAFFQGLKAYSGLRGSYRLLPASGSDTKKGKK